MVTRVHSKGQVLEIKGRQELVVQVGINGTNYTDWISIRGYEGSIELKGNHVHELITAILRFSSEKMRDNYRQLLDITDVITGSEPHKQEPFENFQIEQEILRRKNEKKWNVRRIKQLEEN
tara:strand:+ start:132 stop:494 length:363 start_codon:yes stop_codon:yes gene_type:complete